MTSRGAGLAVALVLCSRLALAPGAGAEGAAGNDPSIWRRVEAGGAMGATWATPLIGVLVSVATSDWLGIEATASRLRGAVAQQGQVRIALGHHQPTRRSLVVGLTHISGSNPHVTPGLGAHAGISLQQALARSVDLRLDLQLLAPFRGGPDADPRAMLAFVWHPQANRANSRRSSR